MLPSTEEKLLTNQLIDILRKREFDPFEKAELINKLILLKRLSCKKCSIRIKKQEENGGETIKVWCKICAKVPETLANQLGISRVEIYRIRKLVDADEQTKQYVRSGTISPEKAVRIVSNLKSENKKKEIEIIERAIKEDMSTREVEDYVAEINSPRLVLSHCTSNVYKAGNLLKKSLDKVPQNSWKNVELREMVDRCRQLLDDIEKKAKHKD